MNSVELENISFAYNSEKQILQNITLQIKKGERFGIFGPNGAGKTTLISIMTGLLQPQTGSIKLLNVSSSHKKEFNKQFGFVPQDFAFYLELSPVENMQFFGAWSGLGLSEIKNRTNELLNTFGLYEVRHKAVKTFSGGMKRRINIAIGVIHHPEILFLDEPTVGVDVQSRIAILEFLLALNKEGTTLIYTSHQLQEAEQLCNRIALIDDGKIISDQSLAHVMTKHESLEAVFLSLTGKSFRD
jgi:ABC-2 type transport system ATP-binding protein